MTEALRVKPSDIAWVHSLGIPAASLGVEALVRDGDVIVEQGKVEHYGSNHKN